MKNVKKLLVCMFACSFVVPITVAGTGCGKQHEHAWGEWTTVTPATCTDDGLEKRVCNDDPSHTETRVIEAKNHAWGDWAVTTPATCVADGVETRVCANDEAHTETRKISATADGHAWGDWAVTTSATCTAAGVETRVCAYDTNHKETRATLLAGHTWGDWVEKSAATCIAEKVEERVCSFNEHRETRVVGELGNHDWNKWTVTTPATCTEKSVETRTCKNDPNHKETREVGEPLDHDYGEWKVTVPSTCVTAGVEERVCSHDATHIEKRAAALSEHTWDGGKVTTAPEENKAGVMTFTCTVDGCGATKTQPIPELEHKHNFDVDWSFDANEHWKECAGATCVEKSQTGEHDRDEGKVTAAATCTDDGVKTFTCITCGATRTEAVAKLNHDWDDWVITPPADGEGKAERVCRRDGCGEKQTKILPALSDDDYYKEQLKPATCTEQGLISYTVSVDGVEFSFDAVVPALGHKNLVKTDAVPATCIQEGNSEYWTCPQCGKLFSDEECTQEITAEDAVIPATGHKNLVKTDAVPATCIQEGCKEYWTCSDCGKLFFDEEGETQTTLEQLMLPLGGHNMQFVEEKPATCAEEGCKEHWTCTVCGKTYSDGDGENETAPETIPAKEHTFSTSASQYKTTETTGKFVWECTACGAAGETVEYQNSFSTGTMTGTNIVLGGTYYVSRTATKDGTNGLTISAITFNKIGAYVVELKYIDEGVYNVGGNRGLTFNGKALYAGDAESGYTPTADLEAYGDCLKVDFDALNRAVKITVKVDGTTVEAGARLNVIMSKTFEANETSGVLLTLTAKIAGEINYGDNEIEITEADAMADTSVDIYTFTPAESKKYSISVPAGITVLKDGKDLIVSNGKDSFANFDATAGTAIRFTFIGDKVGEHRITIGEERMRVLELDQELSFNIVVKKVIGVQIGEIPAGKYNIIIGGAFLTAKQTGWGSMYMSLNAGDSCQDVYDNGLYLRSLKGSLIENESLSANCENNPWVVTATLKEGDVLYFTHDKAWNLPEGNELGEITVMLEPVAE